MKTIELLKKLEKYAVFDLSIFRQLAGADGAYARLSLHRLKEKGYVSELMRNRYTAQKDPLVVASRIVWPSYISLWSAIRHYNLTEQLPHDVWVITTRKSSRKDIRFGGAKIIFVHTKPKHFFGYTKAMIGGFETFVAEPEKAIIDGMLFRKISFSELASIIRGNIGRRLHAKKLASFAIETGNKSLVKRLGYLLDALGMDYHSKLKKSIDNAFVPLEYAMRPTGEKDKKWRVIKNTTI